MQHLVKITAVLSLSTVQESLPVGAEESIAGIVFHDARIARSLIGEFRPDSIEAGVSMYRFVNRNRTQVMTLFQYPGAEDFSFSQVSVTEQTPSTELPLFPGAPTRFVTSLGIRIGATRSDVKALLGVPTKESDDELIHQLTEETAASWLARHRMPEYLASYRFQNDRLVAFEFGFPYP